MIEFKKEDYVEIIKLPEGLRPIIDEEILNEVAGMVEYPTCRVAKFNEKFLSLPREVLIAAINRHQKCFAVEDQHGNLANYFVFISNILPLTTYCECLECKGDK